MRVPYKRQYLLAPQTCRNISYNGSPRKTYRKIFSINTNTDFDPFLRCNFFLRLRGNMKRVQFSSLFSETPVSNLLIPEIALD